jgi:ABC-type transport system substrate-binding protein
MRERRSRVVVPLVMLLLLIGLGMSVGYIGTSEGAIENRSVSEPSAASFVQSSDGDFPTVTGDPLFTLHILVAQESPVAIARSNLIASNLRDIGIEGIVDTRPWPYYTKGVLYPEIYGLDRPGPWGSPEWIEVSYAPHFHHALYDEEGVMYCAGYESEYERWSNLATPPGYGTLWEDWLTKSFFLDSSPASMSYSIQYETELVYDYVQVQVSLDGVNWDTLVSMDGSSVGFETQVLDLSPYVGHNVDVRFRFHSDGWDSDQDGFDTDGACRIDWVEITGFPRDEFAAGNDGWTATSPPQWAVQGFDIAVMGLGSTGYEPGFEFGMPDSTSGHGYGSPAYESLMTSLLALGIDWNENYPNPPDLSGPEGQEAISILEGLQHIWVEDQPFWVLWGRDNFEVGSNRTGWSVALSNLANPNIAQQAVRQAISLSIDRQGMLDAGLEVAPSVWNVQTPILPFIPGYDDVSESTAFSYGSIIKARQLLYDAGYTDIIIPDSDMDGWNDYAELFIYSTDYLTPNTPQQVAEAVTSTVGDLVVSGDLGAGEAKALSKKIDAAIALMDRGNYFAATKKLGDFIDQINAQMGSGRLAVEIGELLIAQAQGIIDVLNSI